MTSTALGDVNASARVGMRRATFWPHLIPYLLVNLMLFLINLKTGGFPWIIFPLLGWGVVFLVEKLAS